MKKNGWFTWFDALTTHYIAVLAMILNVVWKKHNSEKGVKYTKSRKPVEFVGISPEIAKNKTL